MVDAADEIFRKHGRVEELEFDDAFFEHLTERSHYEKHRVSLTELLEVQGGKPKYFLNTDATLASTSQSSPTPSGSARVSTASGAH